MRTHACSAVNAEAQVRYLERALCRGLKTGSLQPKGSQASRCVSMSDGEIPSKLYGQADARKAHRSPVSPARDANIAYQSTLCESMSTYRRAAPCSADRWFQILSFERTRLV